MNVTLFITALSACGGLVIAGADAFWDWHDDDCSERESNVSVGVGIGRGSGTRSGHDSGSHGPGDARDDGQRWRC